MDTLNYEGERSLSLGQNKIEFVGLAPKVHSYKKDNNKEEKKQRVQKNA